MSRFATVRGVPHMDHLLRRGDTLYVSLQRLDDAYRANDAGLIASIDVRTLRLNPTPQGTPAFVLLGAAVAGIRMHRSDLSESG